MKYLKNRIHPEIETCHKAEEIIVVLFSAEKMFSGVLFFDGGCIAVRL